MKILELLKIYAKILIAHFSSVLRNIGLHFSLKCPKIYILGYLLIKLRKITKFMMSIFNGCRTKLDFFTVWSANFTKENSCEPLDCSSFTQVLPRDTFSQYPIEIRRNTFKSFQVLHNKKLKTVGNAAQKQGDFETSLQ